MLESYQAKNKSEILIVSYRADHTARASAKYIGLGTGCAGSGYFERSTYPCRVISAETPCLQLNNRREERIFLNMTSRNGRPELISLLQYMKNTTLDNSNIIVKDERILHLDKIVGEVKQSEEWEAVKMNILEIGLAQGIQQGIQRGTEIGSCQTLIRNVESAMKNFNIDLQQACEGLGTSVEEYERAKEQAARQEM